MTCKILARDRTKWLLIAFCLACVSVCQSARILGVFTSPSRSHLIIHMAVVKALADRGHNVTVVTSVPYTDRNPNYRNIKLDIPGISSDFMSELVNKPKPFYQRFTALSSMMMEAANASLHDPQMKRLMAEESFDLVILGYFLNDFQLGIAAHFKCPVIVSFMIQPIGAINGFIGNPKEVSYVPNVFTNIRQPMTFFERVQNFVYSHVVENLLAIYADSEANRFYNDNFPENKYPSLDEMKRNVSLVLVNHHFSQTPIRPNVPAIVEIGGIQIKSKPDPLPQDIKNFLDNAGSSGAVYFSFGSNVKANTLSKEKVKIFFDVLSKIPQKVIWKWDSSEHPGESSNILYKNWLPQDDILAHPNVRLFITHGGQGSVVESQYHGVPMVGIPFFGDQQANMAAVKTVGYGLSADYLTLTEDEFRAVVLEVLNDAKYRDNVRKFAELYKDRPMSAADTTAFWVEYVIRHKGAPHMQSPAVHMSAWQLHSADVIGFLVVCGYVAFKVILIVFRLLARAVLGRKIKAE